MSLPVFWVTIRQKNYPDMVAGLVQSYKTMEYNFLDSHLDFFSENFGAVSDEHGGLFHQDISTMGKRYQGKWLPIMLAGYCRTLSRDVPQARYSRKSFTVNL